MSKYEIPDDHEWSDEQTPPPEENAHINSHTVTVIYDEEEEYQTAEKYECHVAHTEPDPPTVTHVVTFHNKGNYWRRLDVDDWLDFQDIPMEARDLVAEAVGESVARLTPQVRVVNPDG